MLPFAAQQRHLYSGPADRFRASRKQRVANPVGLNSAIVPETYQRRLYEKTAFSSDAIRFEIELVARVPRVPGLDLAKLTEVTQFPHVVAVHLQDVEPGDFARIVLRPSTIAPARTTTPAGFFGALEGGDGSRGGRMIGRPVLTRPHHHPRRRGPQVDFPEVVHDTTGLITPAINILRNTHADCDGSSYVVQLCSGQYAASSDESLYRNRLDLKRICP